MGYKTGPLSGVLHFFVFKCRLDIAKILPTAALCNFWDNVNPISFLASKSDKKDHLKFFAPFGSEMDSYCDLESLPK